MRLLTSPLLWSYYYLTLILYSNYFELWCLGYNLLIWMEKVFSNVQSHFISDVWTRWKQTWKNEMCHTWEVFYFISLKNLLDTVFSQFHESLLLHKLCMALIPRDVQQSSKFFSNATRWDSFVISYQKFCLYFSYNSCHWMFLFLLIIKSS